MCTRAVTLLGLHGAEVASLANENAEILRDIVGQNFNLLFSRQAQEVAKEIAEGHGGVLRLSRSSHLNGLCVSLIIPVNNKVMVGPEGLEPPTNAL